MNSPALYALSSTDLESIRTATPTNLSWAVKSVSRDAIPTTIQNEYLTHRTSYTPNDRAIIFVQFAERTQYFATLLGCEGYWSGRTDSHEVLRRWVDGIYHIIVATSSLMTSLIVPSIRDIWLEDCLLSVTDLVMLAGRDGLPSRLVLYRDPIVPQPVEPTSSTSPVLHSTKDRNMCRRVLLGEVLDGVAMSCGSVAEELFCNICSERNSC